MKDTLDIVVFDIQESEIVMAGTRLYYHNEMKGTLEDVVLDLQKKQVVMTWTVGAFGRVRDLQDIVVRSLSNRSPLLADRLA